jgi:hypothetical protein
LSIESAASYWLMSVARTYSIIVTSLFTYCWSLGGGEHILAQAHLGPIENAQPVEVACELLATQRLPGNNQRFGVRLIRPCNSSKGETS